MKSIRSLFAALVLGLSAGSVASPSDAALPVAASCPTDSKLAVLTAGSDLVLIARMDVPRQRLVDEAQKSSPDYLDIPIRVDGVVKGDAVGAATVRFFPKDAFYKPSNDAVLGLAGATALLFLTRVDGALYFAGHSPEALQPATEQTIGATRAEAARQMEIIRTWRVDTALPRFNEVRALIARLGHVSDGEQQRVFDQLEALGKEAIPAIIAQMDDRRSLLTRSISLPNHSPNAFESVRHYGPKQVVDGLDAVLGQITGASFGSITNGGSDRQRDATVAGWRIYASDLGCGK